MPLIKLDAIDSTNDFLKAMAARQRVENFTIVTAETQTKGRGQMGAKWHSESGKNLIMSILIKDLLSNISQIYSLNIAVALAIIKTLEQCSIPFLSIKWPNDIMSGDKKVGGILIENSIKSDGTIYSIIGLGLNVNQLNFDWLPKASSLAVIAGMEYDRDVLVKSIAENLRAYIENMQSNPEKLWQDYIGILFKKDIPMPFETPDGNRFMGIIQGVNNEGKLILLVENNVVSTFGIKEIQMLY